jgi:hypothetical protein
MMSSTSSSDSHLHVRASYISVTAAKRLDAQVQNSTPITTRASFSACSRHGVCYCFPAFSLPPHLTHSPTPPAPKHDLLRASATDTLENTPHTPPCPACSKTSSSMTRRRSAVRYVSRSLICRTETSDHVPAATKYATLQRPVEPLRVVTDTLARYVSSATTISRRR